MNVTASQNKEMEDEYIWTVTLDKENPEHVWNPTENGDLKEEAEEDGKDKSKLGDDHEDDDEYDEDLHPAQRLLVKNAFLETDGGELNVIEIETLGYKGSEIKCPLVAMKSGVDYQRFVDQEFTSRVKLRLSRGKGPVKLVGTHSFDFSGFKDLNQTSFLEGDDEDEEEDIEEEEDVEEEEASAAKKNGVSKKRKAEDSTAEDIAVKKGKVTESPDKNGAKKKAKA